MTTTSLPDATPEVIGGRPDTPFLLLCDHASNAVPDSYRNLGLPPAQLERHIGYDIGAARLTRQLSRHLEAEALLTRFTRLLIDPNRGEDDPTLVMRLSDGAVVPGNALADKAEVTERLNRYHRPYHRAIEATLDSRQAAGQVPLLVSIHSFTPSWRGVVRPWHAAVLWDRDPRLAVPVLAALRQEAGLIVGDNEPYDGALPGDTMHRHGTMRGLPHILIEVRQDLIAGDAGADEWAERLAAVLAPLARDPANGEVHFHGSRTDPATSSGDTAMWTAIEAEVLQRLIRHLRERSDVQNIDLMNLAGFCRNCLSNWMVEAARARHLPLTRDEAREAVYGMAYDRWKQLFQREANDAAKAQFSGSGARHVDDGNSA
jgi:predicted N-formylglutamate amidohydrolase